MVRELCITNAFTQANATKHAVITTISHKQGFYDRLRSMWKDEAEILVVSSIDAAAVVRRNLFLGLVESRFDFIRLDMYEGREYLTWLNDYDFIFCTESGLDVLCNDEAIVDSLSHWNGALLIEGGKHVSMIRSRLNEYPHLFGNVL